MVILRWFLLVAVLSLISTDLLCQQLEPRRWAHLPGGVNFVGLGSLYTYGDINFDPALLIEDADVETTGIVLGYIRTFSLAGKSARIDLALPWASGSWEGLLNGQPASVNRQGLADARARLSVNLLGAPALKGKDFVNYRLNNPVTTTVGAAITLQMPTGQYSNEYLINLGNNRWVLRPELGVLHERQNWQFEVNGSVFVYGDNSDFWMGSLREQNPLWLIEGHVVYTFRPGLWAGFSGGFGYGGRSYVNNEQKIDDSRIRYWKLSLGVPINRMQGLNFSFAVARTNTISDANLNRFTMSWSIMFGH